MSSHIINNLRVYAKTKDDIIKQYEGKYKIISNLIECIDNVEVYQLEITPRDTMHGVKCDEAASEKCRCNDKARFRRPIYDICCKEKGTEAKYKTKTIVIGHNKKCPKGKSVPRPTFDDVISIYSKKVSKSLEEVFIKLFFTYSFRALEEEFGPSYKTISNVFDGVTQSLNNSNNMPDCPPEVLYISDVRYGSRGRKKALCIFDLNKQRLLEMIDISGECNVYKKIIEKVFCYRQKKIKKIILSVKPGAHQDNNRTFEGIEVIPCFLEFLHEVQYSILNCLISQLRFWQNDLGIRFELNPEELGHDLIQANCIIEDWLKEERKNKKGRTENSNCYEYYVFCSIFISIYLDANDCTNVYELNEILNECRNYIFNKYPYATDNIPDKELNRANMLEENFGIIYDAFQDLFDDYKSITTSYNDNEFENVKNINSTLWKITESNKGCSFEQIRKKLLFYNEYMLLEKSVTKEASDNYELLMVSENKYLKLYYLPNVITSDFIENKQQQPSAYLPVRCLNHLLDCGILDMTTKLSFALCSVQERINEYKYLRSLIQGYTDIESDEYFGHLFNSCIFGGPCIKMHDEATRFIRSL